MFRQYLAKSGALAVAFARAARCLHLFSPSCRATSSLNSSTASQARCICNFSNPSPLQCPLVQVDHRLHLPKRIDGSQVFVVLAKTELPPMQLLPLQVHQQSRPSRMASRICLATAYIRAMNSEKHVGAMPPVWNRLTPRRAASSTATTSVATSPRYHEHSLAGLLHLLGAA